MFDEQQESTADDRADAAEESNMPSPPGERPQPVHPTQGPDPGEGEPSVSGDDASDTTSAP